MPTQDNDTNIGMRLSGFALQVPALCCKFVCPVLCSKASPGGGASRRGLLTTNHLLLAIISLCVCVCVCACFCVFAFMIKDCPSPTSSQPACGAIAEEKREALRLSQTSSKKSCVPQKRFQKAGYIQAVQEPVTSQTCNYCTDSKF